MVVRAKAEIKQWKQSVFTEVTTNNDSRVTHSSHSTSRVITIIERKVKWLACIGSLTKVIRRKSIKCDLSKIKNKSEIKLNKK